jgi:alkylation response protein AidB-like acyl-CoA dehydrogenase
MSLDFMPDVIDPSTLNESLRADVRSFLHDELAAGTFVPHPDAWLSGWDPAFSRRLGDRGWLGMAIPREYGGHGRPELDRYVVMEEVLAAGAPVAAHWIADRQTAPTLLKYGTEDQRHAYLPAIARGECYFAIGLSEPDAGSDLAAVRTRAEQVDGGWRLTGTKVWTSGAHRATAFVVLARSEPIGKNRHAGLSQFIVHFDVPNLTIRPIPILTEEHHFNEVVLDSVFVPDSLVLGRIGDGWRQVTSELAFERSGPERILSTYVLLPALLTWLAERGRDDSAVRICVGSAVSRLWAIRTLSLAVAGSMVAGKVPDSAAAMVKDLGTRFEQDLIDIVREVTGEQPSMSNPGGMSALLAESVLHSPGFTLRGGTNEILRGVVARPLGLR